MRKVVTAVLVGAFVMAPLAGCAKKGDEVKIKTSKPLNEIQSPLRSPGGMPQAPESGEAE